MLLSIIVPAYGALEKLKELAARIKLSLYEIAAGDYELIFVNDACPKGSQDVIKSIVLDDANVKGVNLSRNFGQHYAITAGLEQCIGDWTVVMDCDLQDSPEEIPNLYKAATDGYDIVFASRLQRRDSKLKGLGSALFYKTLTYATDTH